MLGDPPVVLCLKVADGDEAVARAHRELVLLRRPAHARRRTVDPQQHQSVPPLTVRLQKYSYLQTDNTDMEQSSFVSFTS